MLSHGFGETQSNLAKLYEMFPWSWFKGFCYVRAAFRLISARFSCLILCANIRENLGGENRVMTLTFENMQFCVNLRITCLNLPILIMFALIFILPYEHLHKP